MVNIFVPDVSVGVTLLHLVEIGHIKILCESLQHSITLRTK